MSNSATHIINKVSIEVSCSTMEQAMHLKENLSAFITAQVIPKIEELLEKMHLKSNEFLRFERLHVDINKKQSDDLEELNSQILKVVQEEIDSKINTTTSLIKTPLTKENEGFTNSTDRNFGAFIYFLKNGKLPWYFKADEKLNTTALITYLKSKNANELLEVLKNYNAQRRLVFQYSDAPKLLSKVLIIYAHKNGISKTSVSECCRLIEQNTSFEIRERLSLLLFNLSNSSESQVQVKLNELLQEFVKTDSHELEDFIQQLTLIIQRPIFLFGNPTDLKILLQAEQLNVKKDEFLVTFKPVLKPVYKTASNKELSVLKLPELNKENSFQEPNALLEKEPEFQPESIEEQSLLLNNCGLILLHPFLPTLFDTLQLLTPNKTLAAEKRDLAVHLLHFIATGDEEAAEHELSFEKLLCGIPLAYPIRKSVKLERFHKEEVISLLKTVIAYWNALKNTTPSGLRGQFLCRQGKWIAEDDKIQLFIERQTADVLLNQLPWGLSIVKLPWLNKLIYINW